MMELFLLREFVVSFEILFLKKKKNQSFGILGPFEFAMVVVFVNCYFIIKK